MDNYSKYGRLIVLYVIVDTTTITDEDKYVVVVF